MACPHMKALSIAIFGLLLSGLPVLGHSVGTETHVCPVCGKESATILVQGYSSFEEPARDLSGDPKFTVFGGVETCPWDMYSAWQGEWEIEGEDEREKLKGFLETKDLKIELTKKEFELAGGADPPERIRRMLWVRTCNARRIPATDREWFTAMQLFYQTKSMEEGRWHEHFRTEAIRRLEEREEDESLGRNKQVVAGYLKAELLRQEGSVDSAEEGFRKVVASCQDERIEDSEWLIEWSKEQLIQIEAARADTSELTSWVVRGLLDRQGGREEAENLIAGERNRHRIALICLLDRAEDDGQASDYLWKLLGRDADRLIALAETTSRASVRQLRDFQPEWRKWFTELDAAFTSKNVPSSLEELIGKDQFGNRNVLSEVVERSPEEVSTAFLVALQSYLEGGEALRVRSFDRNRIFLPPLGGGIDDEVDELMDRDHLFLGLSEVLEGDNPEQRRVAAKLGMRLLKEQGDEAEQVKWGVTRVLKLFCERSEELGPIIAAEMAGDWKCPFWKNCCAFAAGNRSLGELLASDRLLSRENRSKEKVFEAVLWEIFTEVRDPRWEAKCVAVLREKDWVSNKSVDYAMKLATPELRKSLTQRRAWLMSAEAREHKHYEPSLRYGILKIERWLVDEALEDLKFMVAR